MPTAPWSGTWPRLRRVGPCRRPRSRPPAPRPSAATWISTWAGSCLRPDGHQRPHPPTAWRVGLKRVGGGLSHPRPMPRAEANQSGDVAQLLGLSQRLQLLQRLILDLPDALAGDVERAADLVERARMLATEAVAQLEDAALAVAQVLQRLAQRLLGEDLGGALVRGLRPLVRDELAELGLLLVADRLLQGDRSLRGALDRLDLLGLDPGDLGDLLGRGLATQLGHQLALGATDLVELLDH